MDQELSEKDFIQDNKKKPSKPFWILGALLSLFVVLTWGISYQFNKEIDQEITDGPFLQVTNRDFSLFLWQFPQHMRVNVTKGRAGYLTGFQYTDKLNIEPGKADEYVVAPPELLFLYHTWNRLIKEEFIINPIQLSEFKEFLLYAEEWQPENWPSAPKDYKDFANHLLQAGVINPGALPDITPPKEVLIAFQGWKNFFKSKEAINEISPTYEQLSAFLEKAPHYARNYWINIVEEETPLYLKTFTSGKFSPTVKVPKNEVAPFLRVNLYNFLKEAP